MERKIRAEGQQSGVLFCLYQSPHPLFFSPRVSLDHSATSGFISFFSSVDVAQSSSRPPPAPPEDQMLDPAPNDGRAPIPPPNASPSSGCNDSYSPEPAETEKMPFSNAPSRPPGAAGVSQCGAADESQVAASLDAAGFVASQFEPDDTVLPGAAPHDGGTMASLSDFPTALPESHESIPDEEADVASADPAAAAPAEGEEEPPNPGGAFLPSPDDVRRGDDPAEVVGCPPPIAGDAPPGGGSVVPETNPPPRRSIDGSVCGNAHESGGEVENIPPEAPPSAESLTGGKLKLPFGNIS